MSLLRAVVIVAVVAALSGAPPSVSAAANQLSSPQVFPDSGSAATVFTFRVRYDGAFAAASVSVTVAGIGLPMALETGSPTAGWWTAEATLPVGAWSTAFGSTAVRGPDAAVDGPVIVVAGPPTAAPEPSATPASPSHNMAPESMPAGDAGVGTPPTAAPDAAPGGIAGIRTVGDTGPTEPTGAGAAADDPVSTVIVVGLAGVASVAIVGALLLVAGRRRAPHQATSAAPVGASTTRPRIARRAPTSRDQDPILVALGVEDEIAARRAIRRARARTADAPPSDGGERR